MATELPRQLNMAIDGDAVTLANCPPGPFLFNGILGFKTEYGAMSGKDAGGGKVEWEVSGGPDAYVMDSGETFWGGESTKEAQSALMVNPVELYFQDMPAPAPQMVVPPGYVLVPIKPTKDMAYQAACYFYGKRLVDIAGGIDGISMANRSGERSFWFAFKKFWRAALANAPQPSCPPPAERDAPSK